MGVQTLEDQAGGDDARQGLLSSSDHPTGHSSGKDSNNCLDILHRSIHHLWTPSLLGRVKDLQARHCGWMNPTFARGMFPNPGETG